MRAIVTAICFGASLAATGCNALAGYIYKAEHFRFGTVAEREFGQSVDRVFKNVQFVLKERNYSIRKAEMLNDEQAQIWSSHDGRQIVFDIKGLGQGCLLHAEIDQAGDDQHLLALIRDIEAMP